MPLTPTMRMALGLAGRGRIGRGLNGQDAQDFFARDFGDVVGGDLLGGAALLQFGDDAQAHRDAEIAPDEHLFELIPIDRFAGEFLDQ